MWITGGSPANSPTLGLERGGSDGASNGAARRLVESRRLASATMRIFPLPRQTVNNPQPARYRFAPRRRFAMSDKLSVHLLGMSVSAEGLWAIGATIIIVGIVAVIATRRA